MEEVILHQATVPGGRWVKLDHTLLLLLVPLMEYGVWLKSCTLYWAANKGLSLDAMANGATESLL